MINATISLLSPSGSWKTWHICREPSFGNEDHVVVSWAFFCPLCQTIWAKHLILGDLKVWPRAQFCEECPEWDTWHPVPGSLLLEEGIGLIDESLLESLPEELIKREFNLHMRAIDSEYISKADDQYIRSLPFTWRECPS
jgi:hypothetical protein